MNRVFETDVQNYSFFMVKIVEACTFSAFFPKTVKYQRSDGLNVVFHAIEIMGMTKNHGLGLLEVCIICTNFVTKFSSQH